MKKVRIQWLILLIFLFTLALRLFLSFSTSTFSDDESYYVARQVENIIENKVPLFNDELSYSGRTFVFSPLYYYLMAFFTIFMPLNAVLHLIPNLFASLMVVVVYLITLNITGRKKVAIFTALASVFIPIFFKTTYNSATSLSFVLFMSLMIIYFFLNIKSKKHISGFIIFMVILSLISPLSLLLILGFLIYLLLCKLGGIKNFDEEKEVIIFATFFTIWSQFVLYKRALLNHGIQVIWQNIPKKMIDNHFAAFSMSEAIYQIGFVLFLFGILVIYNNIFSEKDRKIYLFFGSAISILILLWFRLIPYVVGLIYLSLIFVILFGYFLYTLFTFIKKIHMNSYRVLAVFIISILILIGSIIPTFIEVYYSFDKASSTTDMDSFIWMNTNIPEGAVVLAPVEQGHTLTYFSQKKNVMDSHFILIDDVEERQSSIDEVYLSVFKNNAIRSINRYNVDYIVLSEYALDAYNITELRYIDEKCFSEVYSENGAKIFKALCTIEERST